MDHRKRRLKITPNTRGEYGKVSERTNRIGVYRNTHLSHFEISFVHRLLGVSECVSEWAERVRKESDTFCKTHSIFMTHNGLTQSIFIFVEFLITKSSDCETTSQLKLLSLFFFFFLIFSVTCLLLVCILVRMCIVNWSICKSKCSQKTDTVIELKYGSHVTRAKLESIVSICM